MPKITDLPAASTLAGTEVMPVVQAGTTKKTTAADLAALVPQAVASVNGHTGVVVVTKGDVGLGNVDNTSDADKPISTATQAALDDKASLSGDNAFAGNIDAQGGTVQNSTGYLQLSAGTGSNGVWLNSPDQTMELGIGDSGPFVSGATDSYTLPTSGGTSGQVLKTSGGSTATASWSSLTKSDVGLSNVDNTSDANKPVSTATQTALNGKEPTITAGTTGQYYRGDKTFQTLDKTAVGLSNVDNTSDANKPISTATQTALNGKAATGDVAASGLTTATSTILGRATAATGAIEELTPAQAKTLLSLTKSDVGLANVTNSAQAVAGDIAASGLTTATNTILGRTTAATGAVEELTPTQATAMLNTFGTTTKGLVPSPGSSTGLFLKDDGTWAAAGGGSLATSTSTLAANTDLTNFDTYVDVCTLSNLAAGTYLFMATCSALKNNSVNGDLVAKIYSTGGAYATGQMSLYHNSNNNGRNFMSIMGTAVLASTTTVKLAVTYAVNTNTGAQVTMLSADPNDSPGISPTRLVAIKIA